MSINFGYKNLGLFLPKSEQIKNQVNIFWNVEMKRRQKWLNSDFHDHFTRLKVVIIFLKVIFFKKKLGWATLMLTFFDNVYFRTDLYNKNGPNFSQLVTSPLMGAFSEGTDAFVISSKRWTLLFFWAWIFKLWDFKGLKSWVWSVSKGSNKASFCYLR